MLRRNRSSEAATGSEETTSATMVAGQPTEKAPTTPQPNTAGQLGGGNIFLRAESRIIAACIKGGKLIQAAEVKNCLPVPLPQCHSPSSTCIPTLSCPLSQYVESIAAYLQTKGV